MVRIQKISLLSVLLLVTTIAHAQFQVSYGDYSITYQYADDDNTELEVYSYSPSDYAGAIVIPETEKFTSDGPDLQVVRISGAAFENATGLTSISIPSSVTSIGNNAFKGCSSLIKANFASVKDLCAIEFGNIEANPLFKSHSLFIGGTPKTQVTEQDLNGVSVIRGYAFAGGSQITLIELSGNNIDSIGNDAFNGCENYQLYYTDFYQMLSIGYGGGVSNPMANAGDVGVKSGDISSGTIHINQNVKANAFKGAKWLKNVSFGSEARSIGKNAFYDCEALESITSETLALASIGEGAFQNCKKLASVTIPATSTIGIDAFNSCVELSSITLPTTLIAIGIKAFKKCKKLASIIIPESVGSIGSEAFAECDLLTDVDIKASIGTLPDLLFNKCTSLTNVNLHNDTQTIGTETFKGCTSLTSLPNGEGLLTIGENAFNGCNGIKSLVIPANITLIMNAAFSSCANLTNLTISARGESLRIKEKAFSSNTNSLKYIFSHALVAPDASEDAFEGNTEIKLVLEEEADVDSYKIKKPWNDYFDPENPANYDKKKISYFLDGNMDVPVHEDKITVGDAVDVYNPEERTGWTFSEWQWPESVSGSKPDKMPNTDLKVSGYYYNKNHIENGVKYSLRSDTKEARVIGNDNPVSVTINPSIEFESNNYTIVAIEAKAFKGAESLTTVDLSKAANLTSIGHAIFADCSLLNSVSLPATLTEITDSMFCNCIALSALTIPASVTKIGESAFRHSGIIEMTLPKSITTMGTSVFKSCANLKSIVFETDMILPTLPKSTFEECNILESFTLPTSMEEIGEKAFYNCDGLKLLEMDNVVTIGISAFNHCSNLKEINLPPTIKYLQKNAFSYCQKVEKMTINSDDAPEVGESPFSTQIYETATLYVKDVSKYNDQTIWKEFKKTYPINPQELPAEELGITLSPETYTYDGTAKKPEVTVKWEKEGQEPLTIDAGEYIVSYKDSINVGTATVTILDKEGGFYRIIGSANKTYQITPKAGTLEELLATKPQPGGDNITYNTASQNLIKAGTIKKGISGSLKYSLDKITFDTTIPQGTDAKEYTVYYMVEGDPNYTPSDTLSLKVTINPRSTQVSSISLSQNSYTYDGTAKEPAVTSVTVKYNNLVIDPKEFKVSYANNVNATNKDSKAQVMITDSVGGNFTIESKSTTFEITRAKGRLDNLLTQKPTGIDKLSYTGEAQNLIQAGKINEEKSKDGKLKYSLDNKVFVTDIPQGTKAQVYTIYYKVEDDPNYTPSDTASLKVTINPKEIALSAENITLETDSYIYDGTAKKPGVTVNAGEITIPAEEYTVSYTDNIDAGTATVTITDKEGGNYMIGSASKTFKITSSASSLTNAPTGKNLTYNGSAQELLNKDGKTSTGTLVYSLSQDEATFKSTIPTGTDAKTYTVYYRVKGDDNHSDSEIGSVKVTIAPREVNAISLSKSSYTYTGVEIKADVTVTWNKITVPGSEYTVSYSNNKNVGTATVTVKDKEGGNFTVSGSKTFTITKAPLTISANSFEIFEGDKIPEFTVKYDGFVNKETEAVLTAKPILSCNATASSKPGDYTISVGGSKAANYNITHKSGKLTIIAMKFVSGGESSKDEDDSATYQIISTGNDTGKTPTVAITDDKDVGGAFAIPETVTYHNRIFTVTEIGESTFENNTYLTNVTIPSSITSIGDKAFKGCSNLKSITVYITTPISLAVATTRGDETSSDGTSIFEGVDKLTCVLYVPDGSVDLYKEAPVWSDFKHIVPISTLTGISGVNVTEGEPFDVYNLQGRKVKSRATDLRGLPRGIYIINGKKVAVK